jgi:hypothetical protein
LKPSMVDARGLISHGHIQMVPADVLGHAVYDSLRGPKEKISAAEGQIKSKL